MKVSLEGNRLVHVGKDIPQDKIHGESIGMILFRGSGPMLFRNGLEKAREDQSCSEDGFCRSSRDSRAGNRIDLLHQGTRLVRNRFPADLQQAERIVAAHFHRQEEMEALPVS